MNAPPAIVESKRARLWRESMGLSRRALAERIGWSVGAIATFERGFYRVKGAERPVQAEDILSYRMACASIAYKLSFDWEIIGD